MQLDAMGLKADEIKKVMDPLRSFRQQLAEEIDTYDRLKRGELNEIRNLRGMANC